MQTLEGIRAEALVAFNLWVKVLGMLQQNWCRIESGKDGSTDLVFFDDQGHVFDWVTMPDKGSAKTILRSNGFISLRDSPSFFQFLGMPINPMVGQRCRSRPVYSSGKYWQMPTDWMAPVEGEADVAATTCAESDLERFVLAQDPRWYDVVEEVAAGRKRSHWMWFVFPQLRGLGTSSRSQYFGLADPGEAAAYWDHPVLGCRLQSCFRLLMSLPKGTQITDVFGRIDALKLRSCMTVFEAVSWNSSHIDSGLRRYFAGERCTRTLAIIRQSPAARRLRVH